jgi:hypothetical protein
MNKDILGFVHLRDSCVQADAAKGEVAEIEYAYPFYLRIPSPETHTTQAIPLSRRLSSSQSV